MEVKRATRRRYSDEFILNMALEYLQSEKTTIQDIAQKYGVPYSTLGQKFGSDLKAIDNDTFYKVCYKTYQTKIANMTIARNNRHFERKKASIKAGIASV